MSARSLIVDSLVTLLKTNLTGAPPYITNVYNNVENKIRFWDEVNDFPWISISAGSEQREYLPGDFKWGFLNITFRLYVKDEDSQSKLEDLLSDIELLLDNNNNLSYDTNKIITDIRIVNITTDEGVLVPLGIGEILIQVRYEI